MNKYQEKAWIVASNLLDSVPLEIARRNSSQIIKNEANKQQQKYECRKTWSIRATQKKTYNTYHVFVGWSDPRLIINYKNIYIFMSSECTRVHISFEWLKPYRQNTSTVHVNVHVHSFSFWSKTKAAKILKKKQQQTNELYIQKSTIRPHLSNHT